LSYWGQPEGNQEDSAGESKTAEDDEENHRKASSISLSSSDF